MSCPEASVDRLGVDVSSRSVEFAQSLEQHVQDGLSPELALDLALNELVVAATTVTHASAAAVALARGDEMVCRATTGEHAPDLGIPINTRSGLSGACVRSRKAQNCAATESDERVDAAASRRLGIRSILVVPILEGQDPVGIIEVFSPQPSAFCERDEASLQQFALDCLKLRQLSLEIAQRPFHKLADPAWVEISPMTQAGFNHSSGSDSQPEAPQARVPEHDLSATLNAVTSSSTKRGSRTDVWTLVLGTLVIVATLGMTFLIGFRTGWLRTIPKPSTHAEVSPPAVPEPTVSVPENPKPGTQKPANPPRALPPPVSPVDEGLVVYEGGKVVFRLKSTLPSSGRGASPPGNARAQSARHLWLAPEAADARLRDRVEPEYPAEARAEHRSGEVTLEIRVRQDGSVASIRTVKGDRLLAEAASAAVRNWHYEPYRVKGQPREFQTDVILRFSLPQ